MGLTFVAVDFETANGSRDSACSVGMVRVTDGEIGETFTSLINPNQPFAPMNINIHKITPEMVRDAPTIDVLWPDLKAFIGEDTIVAYNASFDISVFASSLERYDIKLSMVSTCAMVIAKKLYPGRKSYRIKEFCKEFGIPYGHHKSDADALACALLTVKMANDAGVNTIAELAATSKECVKAPSGDVMTKFKSEITWNAMPESLREMMLSIRKIMLEHGVPRELIRYFSFASNCTVNCYSKAVVLYPGKKGTYLALPDEYQGEIDGLVITPAPKSYGVQRRVLVSTANDILLARDAICVASDREMDKYRYLCKFQKPLEVSYFKEQHLFPEDWGE